MLMYRDKCIKLCKKPFCTVFLNNFKSSLTTAKNTLILTEPKPKYH